MVSGLSATVHKQSDAESECRGTRLSKHGSDSCARARRVPMLHAEGVTQTLVSVIRSANTPPHLLLPALCTFAFPCLHLRVALFAPSRCLVCTFALPCLELHVLSAVPHLTACLGIPPCCCGLQHPRTQSLRPPRRVPQCTAALSMQSPQC